MKTPITLITGYLGSGKTTLLRHILENTDKKIAVVMNEFGELGIDTQVVKGKNVDIAELEGGCVCCSLTGEFTAAVDEILEKVKPDWIVVETTGTAEPDALILNMEELPQLRLDATITVADADALTRFPTLGHIGEVQLKMADIILVNKGDLITKEQLEEVEENIKELNPRAHLVRTDHCKADLDILFGVDAEPKHLEKTPRTSKDLEYVTFTTTKPINKERFLEFLEHLPPELYRAKGFVLFPGESQLFNYVAGRVTLEPFPAKQTELVFIGKDARKLDLPAQLEQLI